MVKEIVTFWNPMVIQNSSYKSGEENGSSSSGWNNAFMSFNTPNYSYASTGLSVVQKDSFTPVYNQTGYKYNTQDYTAGSTKGRKDYHFGMKVRSVLLSAPFAK